MEEELIKFVEFINKYSDLNLDMSWVKAYLERKN